MPKVKLQKTHPVLLLVHGRHGNEDVPWVFAKNIPDHWIVVSPRGIEFEPETVEHDVGYSWIEMPENGWPDFATFEDAIIALDHFLHALTEVYEADLDRILALGFSQGAATILATAIDSPNLFKGIASLVGFLPTFQIEEATLKNLPIIMMVGEEDERISIEIAERSRNAVLAAGGELQWKTYPTGHKLNSQGMRDLADWLSAMIAKLDGLKS